MAFTLNFSVGFSRHAFTYVGQNDDRLIILLVLACAYNLTDDIIITCCKE